MNFFYRFSKNTGISNYQKICPPGADLFHAADRETDGRTGGQIDRRTNVTNVTKLIVAFRNFANTPKMGVKLSVCEEATYMQNHYSAVESAVFCIN